MNGTLRDDATAKVPAGGCAANDCDCDKDLFLRSNCDLGTEHPSRLDCDDFDPLRKPGAGFSAVPPDPGQVPFRDWNCDGIVDKAYAVNETCTGAAVACQGQPGFANDPARGAAADYVACKPSGVAGCQAQKLDTRVQLGK